MPEKARITEFEFDFYAMIQELEDEQLKEVLKKRKLYQEEAAKAAVEEAIKREIIASEEDLHSYEYKHEPLKPRLFPLIENTTHRNRIRRSIGRGLLLAGLLPVIWGMVRLNAGVPAEGMVLIVFGLIWMGFSAWIIRQFSYTPIKSLFFMVVLSLVYVIRQLIIIPQIVFMDLFVIVVLYSLAVYGLLFLFRLSE